jgi:hypothetical protein
MKKSSALKIFPYQRHWRFVRGKVGVIVAGMRGFSHWLLAKMGWARESLMVKA